MHRLDKTHYNREIKIFARGFETDLMRMTDLVALDRIRRKLNDLAKSSKKNAGYIHAVIVLVKHRMGELDEENRQEICGSRSQHKVTDHAFVQYLRRAHNLDIEKIKDRILDQNQEHKLVRPLYVESGVIATFLPNINAEAA